MSPMNEPWQQRDYLVFEATSAPVPAYACHATKHGEVWHVRADNVTAAAKVVMAVTGRVGKYAVVPATIVELASPLGVDLIQIVADTPHRGGNDG